MAFNLTKLGAGITKLGGNTAINPRAPTMSDKQIDQICVKYSLSCPHFGLVGEPEPHRQHPNQRKGLDIYVNVINFDTGEHCFKKLYENSKGLHFKHTGYASMYLADFTATARVIPFQVIFSDTENNHE